jgi:hypothetical protein
MGKFTLPPAEKSAAWLGYASLALVGTCVVAMSWHGLVGFARDNLELNSPLCYGVPVALDGSALALAFIALRGVLAQGAAGGPRLLALLVMLASSGFNYWHARSQHQGGAAETFYAGMSILVYLIFDQILRFLRRQDLQAIGAIEPPLAKFRPIRWTRRPIRTLRAWTAAIDHGLTDPQAALTLVRPVGSSREITERLILVHGKTVTLDMVMLATGVKDTRARKLLDEAIAKYNGHKQLEVRR